MKKIEDHINHWKNVHYDTLKHNLEQHSITVKELQDRIDQLSCEEIFLQQISEESRQVIEKQRNQIKQLQDEITQLQQRGENLPQTLESFEKIVTLEQAEVEEKSKFIPHTTLKDGKFSFPVVINGCWTLAGGHGKINYKNAFSDMIEYINNGFNTFDLADHYGPAEDIYGELINYIKSGESPTLTLDQVKGFTKWFPRPGNMSLENVTTGITKSLTRMKLDKLDLLQLHWWDYDDERYLNACQALKTLQNEDKIRYIGLTNFDTIRLKTIVDSGVNVVTNQVTYSIIDRRVEKKMAKYCSENEIYILAYGVCLGGLISERFLGVPEPSQVALNTWSLSKYKDTVNRWGGWSLFQELLETLKKIGHKHSVSLTTVAIKFILQKSFVGAVVLGCRFGIHSHIEETLSLFSFQLDSDDISLIDSISRKGDCNLGYDDVGLEFH
eukprot:gene2834-3522_t